MHFEVYHAKKVNIQAKLYEQKCLNSIWVRGIGGRLLAFFTLSDGSPARRSARLGTGGDDSHVREFRSAAATGRARGRTVHRRQLEYGQRPDASGSADAAGQQL